MDAVSKEDQPICSVSIDTSGTSKTDSKSFLELDGSYGEGGGQILRNAVCYAAILRKDLKIKNIRAGRSKPGLRAQHRTGIQLVSDTCGGRLEGNTVGSTEIIYRASYGNNTTGNTTNEHEKKKLKTTFMKEARRTFIGDTQTAGSICLLLQSVLPCALFGSSSSGCNSDEEEYNWILKGGTNADMAPQYDYWEEIFLPALNERMKLPSDLIRPTVVRRGYFPRGGGEVHMTIRRTVSCNHEEHYLPLPPLNLTKRGELCDIRIRSFFAGNCPKHIAVRMAKAAKSHIHSCHPNIKTSIQVVNDAPAVGSGSGILLVATTTTGCRFAGSALGSKKEKPETTGRKAAIELCSTLADGGCVDDHLQDQLILYMALASGTSQMVTGSLTLHTQTAIWTAEKLCGVSFLVTKFDGNENTTTTTTSSSSPTRISGDGTITGRHLISCQGLEFCND